MIPPILEARGISRRFGGLVAVDNVTMSIPAGQILGVIGANGAGKTTFVNMVTGWTQPSSGSFVLNGRDITGLSPRTIARLGVTRSFQIPQVFLNLTVAENIAIAQGLAENSVARLFQSIGEPSRVLGCEAILDRFSLTHWADRQVLELPQGARKLLDIAMAMTRRPMLLLLDEPTSGVAREEKFKLMDQVFAAIAGLQVTVLFVEHDMEIVARYVSRVVAFFQGRVIADGSCDEVLAHEEVREHVVGRTWVQRGTNA